MIEAMSHNDSTYDGKFYVGVHSTGIYCLPSCRARLPLLKNVAFYPTRERFPDVLPDWLGTVLTHMKAHQSARLTESDLAHVAGVDISTIRRYFKQHHGLTPLAFHRKLRLEHARSLIESGSDYLSAAFECGYESASGFRDAFVREFGQPPGRFYAK